MHLTAARKDISSLHLAKEIDVTQKTASFILSRIREACKNQFMTQVRQTPLLQKSSRSHSNLDPSLQKKIAA